MLPKLCHLDNDLEITIMKHYHYTVYILCSTHDLHTLPGDIFFSHGTPVWPWPVIYIYIIPRGFLLTRRYQLLVL